MSRVLYIKGDQSIVVHTRNVALKDIVSMECSDRQVVNRLSSIKVFHIKNPKQNRYVISVLEIIACIHKEYPTLEVQNMGAQDFIVTYEGAKNESYLWSWCKVGFVTAVTFAGSAFAIMTFNNDSGTSDLFAMLYRFFTGKPKESFGVLELTYSLGLTLGILLFFNHFGKKRLGVDPTPMEVEMRLYENDIQTTLLAEYGRKGKEIDVGQADTDGNSGA